MKMKRFAVLALILCMVFCLIPPIQANAATVDSGITDDNLTWALDSEGTLTISGTGDMQPYWSYDVRTWDTYSSEINKVVVEEGVTAIGAYAFKYTEATEVSLPSTLTSIGEGAFYYCKNLTHIDIPDSVAGYAENWFAGCKSLKSVKMPAGITRMSDTFKNCVDLEYVYIPAGADNITFTCFDGCDSLKSVEIDPNNGNYSFENGMLFNKDKTALMQVMEWHTGIFTVPQTVQTIGLYAFSNCDQLTEIRLPEGLQKIETNAFQDCTGLKTITIPEGVQTIEQHAFQNCTALQEINLPQSLQAIEYGAFENCTSLETIEIPDSVQTIGAAAFKKCSSLKNVVLPSNLKIIEDELFYGCESLQQIVFPENVRYFGETVFFGTYNLEQVFFLGDAPTFEEDFLFYDIPGEYKVQTVYHLEGTEGWQDDAWSGVAQETWDYELSGTASCTQPGSVIYTDAEHGLAYTKNTAEPMHLWGEPALGKYPTTREEGYWIKTCSRCGKQEISATIPKFLETEQTPVPYENNDAQTYSQNSTVVKSYLEPTADGGYLRVFSWAEKIVVDGMLGEGDDSFTVEYYDKDFQYLRSIAIEMELPLFGGYYNDGQYRYLVVGQENYGEDDTVEVVRVIRYTQDWIRVDSASLYGANTCVPFSGNSLRMSHSGNMLYICTGYATYGSNFFMHIKANMTLALYTPTMEFAIPEGAAADDPFGHISSSNDRFIQTDGQDVIAVDYNPEPMGVVVLQRNSGTAGKYYNVSECEKVNILEMYDDVTASTGGLEISDTAYIIAGKAYTDISGGGAKWNIFVAATSKEDFSEEGTTITWLTNYGPSAKRTISTPHLVKVNEDTFAVLWTERENTYNAVQVLKFAYVDQNGQWDGIIYTTEGELSDCKPVVIDGRLVWYTAYKELFGENDNWMPEFYEIYLGEDPEMDVSHRLQYRLDQEPTEQAPGELTICCLNDCYIDIQVQLPALSEADYTCEVTGEGTCLSPEKKVYTWKDTTYGVISWAEESGGTGHNWRPATCDKPKTCTACGATEGSALGHNWQAATCDKPMICTRCYASSGRPAGHIYDDNVDGTCNGCGVHRENVEDRVVVHMFRMYNPNTGEHFYTGSTVELQNLVAVGWNYEGVGFTFPANTGAPVYRLFQPSTGEHLYTMDVAEKDKLMAEGWNYEGIAFNSAYDTEAVQHRLHNPNASVGAYHFTFSEEEMNNLIAAGWEYQGIGWYSCWK